MGVYMNTKRKTYEIYSIFIGGTYWWNPDSLPNHEHEGTISVRILTKFNPKYVRGPQRYRVESVETGEIFETRIDLLYPRYHCVHKLDSMSKCNLISSTNTSDKNTQRISDTIKLSNELISICATIEKAKADLECILHEISDATENLNSIIQKNRGRR